MHVHNHYDQLELPLQVQPVPLETALQYFVAYKIASPSLEYVAQGLRGLTQKGVSNIVRIVRAGNNKLRGKDTSRGSVPPRVIRGILQDGAYTDDQLTAEYLGGVMASAFSEVPRDDRGASMIATISRLSVYEIRAHYLFYYLIKEAFDGGKQNLLDSSVASQLRLFIPTSVYQKAMAFSENENFAGILTHSLPILSREGLISSVYAAGDDKLLRDNGHSSVESSGIVIAPSPLGAELFLWAYGYGDLRADNLLDSSIKIEPVEGIEIPDGARPLIR